MNMMTGFSLSQLKSEKMVGRKREKGAEMEKGSAQKEKLPSTCCVYSLCVCDIFYTD